MSVIPLTEALGLHRAGRLDEAEQAYRAILAAEPGNADAWHLLGLVLSARGVHSAGAGYIRHAIELIPDAAVFHRNLGTVHKDAGEWGPADEALRRAIQIDPNDPVAHNTLGTVQRAQDDLEGAMVSFLRAADLDPSYAEAFNNIGVTWNDLGEWQDAIDTLRHAAELNPTFAAPLNNLGVVHNERGQWADAVAVLRRAVLLEPALAPAWTNLGIALNGQAELTESVMCHRRALDLAPHLAEAHSNLGQALCDLAQYDESEACHRRALELEPDTALVYARLTRTLTEANKLDDAVLAGRRAIELAPERATGHCMLGIALKKQGLLDEAMDAYRRALELDPGFASAHSNLIFAMYHHPGFSAAAIVEEARRWAQKYAPEPELVPAYANEPARDRRLRIGLVSPDFRSHPIANCLLGVLEEHDREYFEFHCYSNTMREDVITARMRSAADAWRSIAALPDPKLAEMIRADGIDILVDLAMHTGRNRLALLGLRPAPVQATWLALPGTTGLSQIDYRLTDPHLDPPGANAGCYSEESLRLPDTFACYHPLADVSPGRSAPVSKNGHVTFGCLNKLAKINAPLLESWAKILSGVPSARLVLMVPAGSHRDRVVSALGVGADRVEFVGWQPRADYLRTYDRIDIALDTHPYNGGVTTSDALWMGVPVITQSGPAAHSRNGRSQLASLDLLELATATPAEYVALAIKLARNTKQLASLRKTVRARMRAAPLTDPAAFTRHLETALRRMWQRWCDGRNTGRPSAVAR